MDKKLPPITATSKEEFANVEEKLSTLSQEILNQIENAKKDSSFGVHCRLKDMSDRKVIMPPLVRSLHSGETDDTVICEGFYFEIPKKKNTYLQYSFYTSL